MKRLHSVILLAFIMGCASMSTVINGKEDGLSKAYDVPFENAWNFSIQILNRSDVAIQTKDKEKGNIFGESGLEYGSYGSYIGVWIDKDGEDKVIVTVYSKRRLATTVGTGLSEKDFHKQFKQSVANYK